MSPTIESELRKLEALVRQRSDEFPATTRRPPAELLRDGAPKHIAYPPAVAEQVTVIVDRLSDDLRFEHLADPERAVWDFAAYCYLRRQDSHVKAFVRQHARPPVERICYLSLEYLRVEQPVALHGVELLPLTDPRIPDMAALQHLADRVDSVAAIPVVGTHPGKMAERARALVAHELRLLQVGVRTAISAAKSQLRFRVGTTYLFAGGGAGWNRAAGAADVLTLNQQRVDAATGHPVWTVPALADNDLERQAQVALGWLDRARFAAEPVIELLYLFFALEALLGDRSTGLKADSLAFRQMTLHALLTDSFEHPAVTWGLYDGPRSAAVHGEQLIEVSAREVQQFGASVRETLGHYLALASERRLTKRSRLLKVLAEYPRRQELADWLLTYGGPGWRPYLASIGLAEAGPSSKSSAQIEAEAE